MADTWKNEDLQSRVDIFFRIQSELADQLGLVYAVPHGQQVMLFDVWNKQKVDVNIIKGTEVKKAAGSRVVEFVNFNREANDGKEKLQED